MRIKIAGQLKPFSHQAGISCMLPGSSYKLQLFPTKVAVYNLSKANPKLIQELPIPVQGPVKDFTVVLDLERGEVEIFGHAISGFFRYWIAPEGRGISINTSTNPKRAFELEKLSLGCNKAQDWELVVRRGSLDEIFPHWFQLAQWMPEIEVEKLEGTALLLKSCEEAIDSGHPERIYPEFKKLYLAGFYGLMVPRLKDDQYQGIVSDANLPIENESLSPIFLLTEGARLIRRLFVEQEDDVVNILPHMPPEFHSGRLKNIRIGDWGTVDIEWTKKFIRTMIFNADRSGDLSFSFKHVKDFRVREIEGAKGERHANNATLAIQQGHRYLFDNFQQ